jgi:mannosidase alpha-like ER degradation enhancer 2
MKNLLISFLVFVLIVCHLSYTSQGKFDLSEKEKIRAEIKSEALWTWQSYKKLAWGHDELNPLKGTPRDWYREPILMTPVDALDMLYVMGEKNEADSTKEYIIKNLNFDMDIYVKNFEITIRFLGGLIASYELSGDKRLLDKAEDLAKRLLKAYNTPTGMPWVMVNLKTGNVKDSITNPAEIGTNILELGTLSKLTGNPVYYETAKKSLMALYSRRSSIDLLGEQINSSSGNWTSTTAHIGSCIDSYYEYLVKASILFKDTVYRNMWEVHAKSIQKNIAEEVNGHLWYGRVDLNLGKKTQPLYGALDAYFPALLALSGDLEHAKALQESSDSMWNQFVIEPEQFNYKTMEVIDGGYALRPEIIESAYYLYHYTHDPKYLEMGKKYFEDIRKYCKTEYGYAALKDVRTKEKLPSMESFLFAETFKYLYLLFSPDSTLEFDKVIFTTEAHPLKRQVN